MDPWSVHFEIDGNKSLCTTKQLYWWAIFTTIIILWISLHAIYWSWQPGALVFWLLLQLYLHIHNPHIPIGCWIKLEHFIACKVCEWAICFCVFFKYSRASQGNIEHWSLHGHLNSTSLLLTDFSVWQLPASLHLSGKTHGWLARNNLPRRGAVDPSNVGAGCQEKFLLVSGTQSQKSTKCRSHK